MKNGSGLEIELGSISFNTKHGAEIYRRSLSILLECAVRELYPKITIQVGQTLMKGYYYEVYGVKGFPKNFIKKVTARMKKIVAADEKFNKVTVSRLQFLKLCKKFNRPDKYKAMLYLPIQKIDIVFLRGFFDFVLAESLASTGFLKTFRLVKYNQGFIVQFPVRSNISRLPETGDRQRKLYRVYRETKEWDRILGIRNAGDLNQAVKEETVSTIIKVQEAFHEKKISRIADGIKSAFPGKKIIFVAGPSASGKTTFLKRLGVQIRASGLLPAEISLDNYFVSREETPKASDGSYDYESLRALDISFLRRQINDLLKGREIKLQEFNFRKGKREDSGGRLKLGKNSVLLVEGIHALNPRLLPEIPRKQKFNIFVSALTQLCIDNDNRIFTSDLRLVRRIIRDYKFRGYRAAESIKRFPKVREGEDRYIFPFQDQSDIFFNSSLIYEYAVIKKMAQKLLRQIEKRDESYYEAKPAACCITWTFSCRYQPRKFRRTQS